MEPVYEVHVPEYSFSKRRRYTVVSGIIFIVAILLISSYQRAMISGLIISGITIIAGTLKLLLNNYTFITSIKIEKDQLIIFFTKRGKPKSISGPRKDFLFYNDRRRYSHSLNIWRKSKRIFSQHEGNGWTKELMDQVCREVRKKRQQ